MAEYCDILEIGHAVEFPKDKIFKDLTNFDFGRWVVKEYRGSKDWSRFWLCQCSCELKTLQLIKTTNMKAVRTSSCGCFKSERSTECHTTHGKSRSVEWKIWNSMMQRCYNPKNKAYARYGGRGIKVDASWHHPDNFLNDVGTRPYLSGTRYSIDRPNVNGDYGPDNWKWSTDKEQANNTRKTIYLELNGEKKSLCEWSDIYKISSSIIRKRIKNGWTSYEALILQKREKSTKYIITIEWNGETHTLEEWSKITGMKRRTIQDRFYAGMTGEQIFTTPIKQTNRWNKT